MLQPEEALSGFSETMGLEIRMKRRVQTNNLSVIRAPLSTDIVLWELVDVSWARPRRWGVHRDLHGQAVCTAASLGVGSHHLSPKLRHIGYE